MQSFSKLLFFLIFSIENGTSLLSPSTPRLTSLKITSRKSIVASSKLLKVLKKDYTQLLSASLLASDSITTTDHNDELEIDDCGRVIEKKSIKSRRRSKNVKSDDTTSPAPNDEVDTISNNKDEVINEKDNNGVNTSTTITEKDNRASVTTTTITGKRKRFMKALPRMIPLFRRKIKQEENDDDDFDEQILKTSIPNMINLGVVPIVNSVDTFWVGRLGVALALAGQSAANQASFTVFFLIAFLPNIVAPLVASAVASDNVEEAQQRVSESLWLCNTLGLLGTIALVAFPRKILSLLVLPANAPAMDYAAPYLRWRALGMVPSLISATGFAAYRGLLNTITPLKVSLATNALNLILDPLCIFAGGFGFVGAAVATAASELFGGLSYLKLLLQRKLIPKLSNLVQKPPSFKSILPLLQGGAAMLLRQLALNVGFLVATRRAQLMDPTGVAGAAYGITMQMYSVGIILLVAMQSTAAALVPATLMNSDNNNNSSNESDEEVAKGKARTMADRLISWSSIVGLSVGALNYLLLPVLVPVFSTLPAVREAVRRPALIASLIHIMNGPILAGEGILMGLGCYRGLAIITTTWITAMVACLKLPMAQTSLDGIMWSILLSSSIQLVGVIGHYLKIGPLAKKKEKTT